MERKIMPIQDMIYEIRGLKVMMDRDLAGLYEVELKVMNRAVKRNIKRFPDDFMFQLTDKEWAVFICGAKMAPQMKTAQFCGHIL